MGRELKRVALDFEWPLSKVWQGFVNPHYTAKDCEHCAGSGSSPDARRLKDQWYGNAPFRPEDRGGKPFEATHAAIVALAKRNLRNAPAFYGASPRAEAREAQRLAHHFNSSWSHHLNADDVAALVEAGRLKDLTHTFTAGQGWAPRVPPVVPTPEEVNLWSLQAFGHDSINQWIVVGAECKRLGVPDTCEHCDGEGCIWPSPEAKTLFEEWKRIEPPAGPGYQIWETVSEGSPISPVFSTPEDLARHMTTTRWGADDGTPYEQWLKFICGPGWALSLIVDASGLRTGVQAA